MSIEQEIDCLIETGWLVFNNNFSEAAFEEWRQEALKWLTAVCGPNHPYTDYFKNNVFEEKLRSLPLGVGVLEAAKASAPSSISREPFDVLLHHSALDGVEERNISSIPTQFVHDGYL